MDRCARPSAPSTSRLQPSPSPRRRPRGGSRSPRSPNHGASSFGTSSHQLKTSERMNLSHSPILAHSQPQYLTTLGQTVNQRSPTTYIYSFLCPDLHAHARTHARVAERSKALVSSSSLHGRGFESHRVHTSFFLFPLLHRTPTASYIAISSVVLHPKTKKKKQGAWRNG